MFLSLIVASALPAITVSLPASPQRCHTVPVSGVDLCPGFPDYSNLEVADSNACAAACCKSSVCLSWVTRPITVTSGNCSSGSQCCWLKPQDCRSDVLASPTAVSGTVVRAQPPAGATFVDTESWIGTSYTPARAANQLWWASYPAYRSDIVRELRAARNVLEIKAIRVFLHSLAWESVGANNHSEYITDFLSIAEACGLHVGFVLFGDGWNHGTNLPHPGNRGANVSCASDGSECCPRAADGFVGVPGCSNSCWMANPQDAQRGTPGASFDDPGNYSVASLTKSFKPYVDSVLQAIAGNRVVLWLEVYNEPCEWRHWEARICTKFEVLTSTLIKELAFAWVTQGRAQVPVLSSWDERNNSFTDILSVHLYSDDFALWTPRLFAECPLGSSRAQCVRGAVVTEAGARWGSGDPLNVVHFLSALREQQRTHSTNPSTGPFPFVPGAMLAWTLFVGNDNTRWSAGPPCAPVTSASRLEPPVPWCGLLWPDGTPVSETEAAAIRRYARRSGKQQTQLMDDPGIYLLEDFLLPLSAPGAATMTTDTTFNASSQTPFLATAISTANGSVTAETAFWPRDQSSSLILTLTFPSSTWAVMVNFSTISIMSGVKPLISAPLLPRQQATVSSGVVPNTWNILRFQVVHQAYGGHSLSMWLNPIAQPTAPHLGSVRPLLSTTVPAQEVRSQTNVVAVDLEIGVGESEAWALLDYVSLLAP